MGEFVDEDAFGGVGIAGVAEEVFFSGGAGWVVFGAAGATGACVPVVFGLEACEVREVGGEFVPCDDVHAGAAFDHGVAEVRAFGEHEVAEVGGFAEGEVANLVGGDHGVAGGADEFGVEGWELHFRRWGGDGCGRLDVPDAFEDAEGARVVGGEFWFCEWEEVVFGEVGFGAFCEVLLVVGEGVGAVFAFVAIAVAAFDAFVFTGGFGGGPCVEDFGVIEADDAVVVGVGEFVEGEVGHAAGFRGEGGNVGELDAFGHGRVAAVVAEPVGSGVVFGALAEVLVGG